MKLKGACARLLVQINEVPIINNNNENTPAMSNLIQELQRRKVFRVAAVYAVVAWLLIQVVDVVLPTFNAPQWVNQSIILLLMLGLPVTVVVAWAFDITPQGIQKTPALESGETTGLRKRDYFVNAALLVLIAVVVEQQFVFFNRPAGDVSIASQESAAESGPRVEELIGSAIQTTPQVPEKSVAVLPFVSMSSGEEDGYFADGLTEELLNVLAQLSDLKVPGRTSSFFYKDKQQDLREIGQALGVAYLLGGSVRRAGDQIRVTAQLVSASDGFNLWSATYDRTMDDIFAIQDEIASEVTSALQVTLLGEEAVALQSHGTNNAEAQNLFLIAMARLREQTSSTQHYPEVVSRTRDLFQEIVVLDPSYVEAWAGLAQALLRLASSSLLDGEGFLLDADEGLGLAREALARAQALAPNAPATLLAEALVSRSDYDGVWRDASEVESILSAFDRAVQADPNNVMALELNAGFLLN
jgi:TolB-like protein